MGETYISVKDYAAKTNRSIQGVYQQMKREKNAEQLKGHIIIKQVNNRDVKYLDEYAVKLLSQNRNNVPAVVLNIEDKEKIKMLESENKSLLVKIAEQADKLSEQADELYSTKTLLLESNAESKQAKEKLQETENKIENQIKENVKLQEQLKALEEQLAAEKKRKLSFKERLFGKKREEEKEENSYWFTHLFMNG